MDTALLHSFCFFSMALHGLYTHFPTLSSHSANLPNVSIPSTHYSESKCSSCHLRSDLSLFIICTIFSVFAVSSIFLVFLVFFNIYIYIFNICGSFQYFLSNCTICHSLLLALHVLLVIIISCDFYTLYQFIYLFSFICDFVCGFIHHILHFQYLSYLYLLLPLISVDLLSFAVLKHFTTTISNTLTTILHQSYVSQLFYTFLVSMH